MKKIIFFLIFLALPFLYVLLPLPKIDEHWVDLFAGSSMIFIFVLIVTIPLGCLVLFVLGYFKGKKAVVDIWKSEDPASIKFFVYRMFNFIFLVVILILWARIFLWSKHIAIETFGVLAMSCVFLAISFMIKKNPIVYSDGNKIVLPKFSHDKNIFGEEEFLVVDVAKLYYGQQPSLTKKFGDQLEFKGLSQAEGLLFGLLMALVVSFSRQGARMDAVPMACVLEMKDGRKLFFNLDNAKSFADFMSLKGISAEKVN